MPALAIRSATRSGRRAGKADGDRAAGAVRRHGDGPADDRRPFRQRLPGGDATARQRAAVSRQRRGVAAREDLDADADRPGADHGHRGTGLERGPLAPGDDARAGQQAERPEQERPGAQDGDRAPGVLQPGAEAPALAARRQVAVDGGGCAAATIVGLQQNRPDVPAVRRACLLMLDQVLPGAVDERLGRARGRTEFEREGGVRDAVELSAQEGVALVLGERRQVAEHVADPAAALGGDLRLGSVRGAKRAALVSVVEHDGVRPHPRELVERAVADQPVEPGPQFDVALVASQRTARTQHRLLDHVLGLVGRRAEDLACVAFERAPVALIDLLECAVVSPPERRDEALVVGLDAPIKHGTGSGCGSIRPRPSGSLRVSTGDPRSGARRAAAAGGRASR